MTKILIYGLNFAPEPTGIGKYTGEMATWLAERNYEVRVIAAPPYYPAWSVGAGHSAWRSTRREWNRVEVWRSPLWVPAEPTGLKRLAHLASFALLSIPALISQLAWKPDVVLVVAPALMCAPGGWLTARLCRAKAWLHIQDFEVDAAFQFGLVRGALARRATIGIERWLMRRFDRVSTISRRMMDLLALKGVEAENAVLFPNWVDISAISPAFQKTSYRAELGIPEDAVVALYSGSMGAKQGLELLPNAARELRDRLPKLIFVLCGDGVCQPMLERECAGLTNVRMLPLQPAARLGELLVTADIHLLPQNGQAADLVMPSKLTGMLSSGRPVLATADPQTELAAVIAGCGIVVPPGNLAAFTEALVELSSCATKRARLGAAARRYAEEHLARDRVLVDFEQALRRCVAGDPSAVPEPAHVAIQTPAKETTKTPAKETAKSS